MLELDTQGWILSPNETKKELLSRKDSLEKDPVYPFLSDSPAHDITEKLYRFQLKQIPIFYSKKSLFPWQAGMLWSYQRLSDPPFPVIQIRKQGHPKEVEMLAHELVHAARFSFKEPFFEEFLAYQTSSSKLYRFWGPIFIFQQEPLICIIIFWLSFFSFAYLEKSFFLWIPFFLSFALLARLLCLHAVFFLAKQKIRKGGVQNELPLLLRLSDKEIFQMAILGPLKFLKKNQKDLRLSELFQNYFS